MGNAGLWTGTIASCIMVVYVLMTDTGDARDVLLFVALIWFSALAGFLLGLKRRTAIGKHERTTQFYAGRSQLPGNLDSQLGSARDVWCAFHTGGVAALQGGLFDRPRNVRIILSDPDSTALGELNKIVIENLGRLKEDIAQMKLVANMGRGDLRLFDGPIGNSIVIADPEIGKNGWVMIECLIPNLEVGHRPSIKFYRRDYEELFMRIKNAYNRLWNACPE